MERTDTPWNLFNYPLYSSVKAKCKAKPANTCVSAQLFREYASGSTRSRSSRFCQNAYTYMEGHSQLVCRGKARPPTAEPITEPNPQKTGVSNDLLIQGRFTRSGSVISTPVKPNVLQFVLQGCDTNIINTLVTGFTEVFGSLPRICQIHLRITLNITSQLGITRE